MANIVGGKCGCVYCSPTSKQGALYTKHGKKK